MKFNTQLLCTFFLFSSIIFGQVMPLDFSDSSDEFIPFGGTAFAFFTDPNDSQNVVGEFYNDGSEPWQGFYIDLNNPIDLDFQNTISLSFYSFDSESHNIVLKLENGLNPDVEVALDIPYNTGWTDNLTFDFSDAVLSSDGTTPVDATGYYNRLTLFIDGGFSVSGSFLIDTIDDGSSPSDPNEVDVEYNYLVWEDNFETPGIVNPSKWHHQTQVIIPGVGWANGEEQHYTNRIDNSYVDNSGFLNIVAKKETFTDQNLTKNYTSARLNSKFAFTYGRVDVRAKLPLELGTWPAIWMLGKNINENGGYWDPVFGTTNWPACGEVDIMEHGIFPSEDINYIGSALHTPCCFGGNPNSGGTIASNLESQFHVYSVNWSPDQITFLLDGVGFYTYNPVIKDENTWPFFEDQYMLLNVAMGGVAGPVDPQYQESSMIIDYVRVYQENPLNIENTINSQNAKAVKIYPNPVKNEINLTSKEPIVKLKLYDFQGKLILEKSNNTDRIDVSSFNSGVYFIEAVTNNKKSLQKVIIK